jgi:hypothetical protein
MLDEVRFRIGQHENVKAIPCLQTGHREMHITPHRRTIAVSARDKTRHMGGPHTSQ